MKVLLILTFVAFGQCALLGRKKCTYGPSYWCSHIEHARECKAVQHCMTTVWKNQLQGLTGSSEGCYDVIKVLDDVRHSGAPDLLEKMAESCTKMPSEKHSKCKELMMKYQREMLLLLQSGLPSVNVAVALGLCGKSDDSVPRPHVESMQGIEKAGNYCTDCLKFFGDLQEIVNNTELKIAELLKEKVCTKLGFFENLCNQTVDTYTQFIIMILVQQLNPEDLCYLFQLCPNTDHGELMKSIKYLAAKAPLHTLECDVCESIAKDLQNVLRDTALQNDILSVLKNKVCTLLPGDLATQCQSYVSQYGVFVFEVLIAELDPPTICQTIGVCNATEDKGTHVLVPLKEAVTTVQLLSPEAPEQAQSAPLCFVCEYVMEKLESLIGSNATKEEILAAVEKVCSILPESKKAACTDFVEEYGNKIVELLEKVLPDAVCTALGLCFGDKPVHVDHPVSVMDEQTCMECKSVVAYGRQFLNNPDNIKIIESVVDRVCVLVPPSYKPMCVQIINTYLPSMLKMLDQYDDPQKVCSELKLCNSTKTDSNKSGQGAEPLLFMPMMELQPSKPRIPCSQGPKVWCASMENARHCKAMKYCVENGKLKLDV